MITLFNNFITMYRRARLKNRFIWVDIQKTKFQHFFYSYIDNKFSKKNSFIIYPLLPWKTQHHAFSLGLSESPLKHFLALLSSYCISLRLFRITSTKPSSNTEKKKAYIQIFKKNTPLSNSYGSRYLSPIMFRLLTDKYPFSSTECSRKIYVTKSLISHSTKEKPVNQYSENINQRVTNISSTWSLE